MAERWTGKNGATCYHADPDCWVIKTDAQARTIEFCDWHDLDPCPECVGGADDD